MRKILITLFGKVFTFSTALFAAGYVLQQRTVSNLRDAVRPRVSAKVSARVSANAAAAASATALPNFPSTSVAGNEKMDEVSGWKDPSRGAGGQEVLGVITEPLVIKSEIQEGDTGNVTPDGSVEEIVQRPAELAKTESSIVEAADTRAGMSHSQHESKRTHHYRVPVGRPGESEAQEAPGKNEEFFHIDVIINKESRSSPASTKSRYIETIQDKEAMEILNDLSQFKGEDGHYNSDSPSHDLVADHQDQLAISEDELNGNYLDQKASNRHVSRQDPAGSEREKAPEEQNVRMMKEVVEDNRAADMGL